MASHIPLLEDDRVIGLDGKPLAPLPVNAWTGLPFEIHPHMRQGEVAHRTNPHALVLVHQNSRGRSRIASGREVYDLEIAPGHVDFFAPHFRMDHARWDCTPGQVFAIDVDPQLTRQLMHDVASLPAPPTRLGMRDQVLSRLAACIKAELEAGCASGRLFAESVSLAVLSRLLVHCGSAGAGRAPPARRLSPADLRRTVGFVEANLAADLSVAALAADVGMSGFTFARLFKAATGVTPHRFVLSRRIERATSLLAGDLSLSAIALAVGFSSQSHFTESFRRATGRTPAAARRAT